MISFSGRLLDEGLHYTRSFEMSDDVETVAGSNGALLTLVNDTGSQGEPHILVARTSFVDTHMVFLVITKVVGHGLSCNNLNK